MTEVVLSVEAPVFTVTGTHYTGVPAILLITVTGFYK
jgi:hypothetical protein